MAPGDIAFKCNFATLDTKTNVIIKRRADRQFEDVGPVLCAALNGARHQSASMAMILLSSHIQYHVAARLPCESWYMAAWLFSCAEQPLGFTHLAQSTTQCLLLRSGVKLPSFPHLIVKAKYATEHRCGVVVSGPGLSDDVSGTDPLKDNLPLQVLGSNSCKVFNTQYAAALRCIHTCSCLCCILHWSWRLHQPTVCHAG